ncbi:MAG: hypothetical protein QM651_16335, partial [Rhodoblastus sp.]
MGLFRHARNPVMAGFCRIRVESAPVVDDFYRYPLTVRRRGDPDVRRLRVAFDIAQRFLGYPVETLGLLAVDLDAGVERRLDGQPGAFRKSSGGATERDDEPFVAGALEADLAQRLAAAREAR